MKWVKLELKLWRQVQTGVASRGKGTLFAGGSPVVDTNDRWGGLGKCAVGKKGEGTLHTGGRCETIVLFFIKHHTPGNNPKDYTQHLEHRESLKSRMTFYITIFHFYTFAIMVIFTQPQTFFTKIHTSFSDF
jgi:hypothetical protein